MKSTLFSRILFSVVLLHQFACTSDPVLPLPTFNTRVSGQMLDAKTNAPISDIEIILDGYNTVIGDPVKLIDGLFYSERRTILGKTKTDASGRYSFAFNANIDSMYRLVPANISGYAYPDEQRFYRKIRSNETQTQDFNPCQYAPFTIQYFQDLSIQTDSIRVIVNSNKPCGDRTTSNRTFSLITSAGGGVSDTYTTEDNTDCVIRWQRIVNNAVVQTRDTTVRTKIGQYPFITLVH
ncbi:MAG: hypothetical protein RL757_1963 [Bacteroidota bacterium]|jgi:hypothetical protein